MLWIDKKATDVSLVLVPRMRSSIRGSDVDENTHDLHQPAQVSQTAERP